MAEAAKPAASNKDIRFEYLQQCVCNFLKQKDEAFQKILQSESR